MTDVPLQIIVAAFQEEDAADQALRALKEAKKEKLISIDNAAVIRKDEKGKLHIKETADMGGGKGAGVGALVGGAIGLIAGPLGVAAGGALGAAVGGITAKLYDGGFKDERLEKIGASLQPETSAIVAVIEHRWVADLERELAEEGADVMTSALAADIAEQLQKGGEVSYTAISDQESMAGGRVATTEDEAVVSGFIATDEGMIAAAGTAELAEPEESEGDSENKEES
ncbi:MAG: DUF1269 domain-containing protein [Anaerolineales bacterium]